MLFESGCTATQRGGLFHAEPTTTSGYHCYMVRGVFVPKGNITHKTSNVLDIAARHFVYKLFEATGGRRTEQQLLRGMGETLETVYAGCACKAAYGRGWA